MAAGGLENADAMPNRNVQAIAGVSGGADNVVMSVYPSISTTGLGRLLGRLYESIPIKLNGVKLSHLLFALPSSPLPFLIYFWLKIAGRRYVLTSRSLQIWQIRLWAMFVLDFSGDRMVEEIPLPAVSEVDVEQFPGHVFYRAADLVLYDSEDGVLGRLEAVPRAEIFRQIILDTRDALTQTEAALATIAARKPA